MRKKKPILLHRETLRHLDSCELGRAAAAFSYGPCNPDTLPLTGCGDQCPTYSCRQNYCA
jgi:hypothetical protein